MKTPTSPDNRELVLTRLRHWTVADRQKHEQMGFRQGWGQCADQLAAIVAISWNSFITKTAINNHAPK
jgi:uncharacterized protein YndB with AHSA1/START domain